MALSLSSAGAIGSIVFLVGHAAADLLWFSFISYSVEKGRDFLSQKVVQAILYGSTVFLILFGLFLIAFG